MSKRTATVLPFVLLFVLVAGKIVTAQTVLHVDDDAPPGGDGVSWATPYDTLPAALTAAQPGDQIWVAAGTYVGNFTLALEVELYGGFAGTETELTERDWTANATILDGNASGSVVTSPAGATETTRIDGFTITNGSGTAGGQYTYGGGLYLAGSSPTIENNAITDNSASYGGGGMYLNSSSPTIANNTITGNSASERGGGVYMANSSPTIANTTITGNGAGLYGGGLYVSNSSPTIVNNSITNNSAYRGGGLNLYNSSLTIVNTIVAFNSSGVYMIGSGTPTLRYNCVYGNTVYDYSGLADPTGIDGNISEDPLLAEPQYGNVHIQPDSPCVDTGSNADVWGDFDVDGEVRTLPLGGTVDIGADESDGTLWPGGPHTVTRVSTQGEDTNDGSSWALAMRTVQAGIDAASALGGEVWVQAGTYEERITLHAYANMYGGFAGDEALRDERDWVANVTILDGKQQGSVVTVRAGHRVSTIDGFTITNGSGFASGQYTSGGGVYLVGSSPTIAHNKITGNDASIGGGLYSLGSFPLIANNTITGNGASSGGALYLERSSPLIANNTITGNFVNSDGALFLYNSSPTIANTIVAFNSSGVHLFGGAPTLRHNCVYGNTAYNFDGLNDPTGSDGNISEDPLLAAPEYGNVHIQPDSPCVDAGSNADASGGFDIDSEPRIQPQGGTVDIGADESDGTVWSGGPYTIIRVSAQGDDTNDGSSWALAKRTVQDGVDVASALSGEVWIRAGTYGECITLHAYAHMYGGFAGDEAARDERDWEANATILDGQQNGSVVTVRTGYRVSTIDGFTITHGSGTLLGSRQYGGGLYLSQCSPTIANNMITDNRASRGGGGLYLSSSSPMIANNTIANNSAFAQYGRGGGLYLFASSPTIVNNTIANNSAYASGGAMYLSYSSPTIAQNTIEANNSDHDYGGGIYLHRSSPTIEANAIAGNSWGGLYLELSSPTIVGNTISDNGYAGLYVHRYSPTILSNTIKNNSGAGLYLVNSSPTITNNTITENTGGGLYLLESNGSIENNEITGNIASEDGGDGGGLSLHGSSPTIANNTITGNSAEDSGGGLYLFASSPTIANNTIANNSAWWGGGLCLNGSSPTIANNTVANNSASCGGGLLLDYSSPTIANNTISGNGAGYGGALYLSYSSPTIENTIVAFNSSGVYMIYSGTPTLRNNCVYDNTAYDYSGLTDPTGTDGNISEDPLLADSRYGNLHIQPDSPCVGAGSNTDVWGDFDIDGEPRIQPLDGTVDIGADESDGTVWAPGPYVTVRVHPEGDDTSDGSSWALAKRTVQAGIDAASALGGEVWVKAGTYGQCVTLHAYAHVYGGFAGTETVRDERDWVANVTTLDGQQQGSVVIARGGHGTSAVDGFTITNGSAQYGGGLYLFNSSPTIANNRIRGNSASAGGGLAVDGSYPTIANNTIAGNGASVGGGLYTDHASPTIANNSITGNIASSGGGLGVYDSSGTIVNTIVAFNSSGIDRYGTISTTTLRYNCVYGNTAYDYSGLADPTGTDGNVSADPLFVREPNPGPDGSWGTDDDDYGDLHLSLDSPLVDAGDNDAVPADVDHRHGDRDTTEPIPLDLDGYARFVDDPRTVDTGNPGPPGPIVDIGAYEFRPGDCTQGGETHHDGDVDFADYAGLEACLVGPDSDPPVGCECFDLNGNGRVDLADLAIFQVVFTGH